MKAKVYVTRKIPEEAYNILQNDCQCISWPAEDVQVDRDVLKRSVQDVQGLLCLLTDKIDEEILAHAPQLQIVSNMAVGYDNIDVAACTQRGIMVTNTPGVLTETTADLTFALLLAAARRIPEACNDLLQGGWRTWSPLYMAGRDVFGATLGLIGLGRIAQAVARRAQGFSMPVLYWNRTRKPEVERELGLQYVDLDQLLQQADFISIHVPLNEGTRGLLGEREFGLMKKSAVLINTARGPIVDRTALYNALVSGRIWGAGLDVYDQEPVDPNDRLIKLRNVVALPHIGSASLATRTKMAVLAAENLIVGLKGKRPPNLVN